VQTCKVYETNELVGLKFTTNEDCSACIHIYSHGPDWEGYFSPVGHNVVVLPREKLPWLQAQLAAVGISYTEVPVVSMGDLPPEEVAALRRQRKFLGTPEDKKQLLEELRKKYGA